MRKFVLTLREVEMDDYMKPLRYRGKEDSVVFLEQQLEQEGKQAVYGDVLGYLQRSFERMKQEFIADKYYTDEDTLIKWNKYDGGRLWNLKTK